MQLLLFNAGDTSKSADIFFPDSSSTTGAGLSGLVFNTASLAAYYRKNATGTATAITLATQTVGGAWSSGGLVEIDATHQKGMYRFDIPDTVLATAGFATLFFYGATNLAPVPVYILVGAPVVVPDTQKVDLNTIKTQAVTNAAGVTFSPFVGSTGAAINGTNANTLSSHDPGATIGTSTYAGGAVASVTGNVGGNVTGSVGSISGVTFPTNFSATSVDSSGRVLLQPTQTGITFAGTGSTPGLTITGGTTAAGALLITGGSTSGDGIKVTTTLGHGFEIIATGSGKDGLRLTGGSGGYSFDATGYVIFTNWAIGGVDFPAIDPTTGIPVNATYINGVAGQASIRAAVGLTTAALTDTRVANLDNIDATVSSRGTSTLTQTQVTGGAYSIQSASCVLGDTRIANLDAAMSTRSTLAAGAAMTLTSAYDFAKGTVAMTESYAANGAAPTAVQALYAIHQMLMDFGITGTTLTVKKLNNSTTAFVVTLNDDTSPTAAART